MMRHNAWRWWAVGILLLCVTIVVALRLRSRGGAAARPVVPNAETPREPEDRSVETPVPAPFTFEERAAALGIRFEYFRGDTGDLWTIEPHGGGVALLDYDSDGRLDLFFVNGRQLPPKTVDEDHAAELYRNDGASGFTPVAEAAGARVSLYGQGCAAADVDNDGFADLVVTGWRRCILLHNRGDGTFGDVSAASGCAGGEWNTGACFADFDRDGCLDLYLANYLHFDPEKHTPCLSQFQELSYCGPSSYTALNDHLYRNQGDCRFRDVTEAAGMKLPYGPAFGGVASDVDDDGWIDLLVANDGRPNFLFHNRGAQAPPGAIHMKEVALAWGIGVNGAGMPEANMGIACGDFDGNGLVDFGISHFYQEHFTLYKNLGSRGFLDVTETIGLDHTTRSKMGWGTGFFDPDADGWLDLFVVNGHLNHFPKRQIPYEMTPQVFQNQAGRFFADVSAGSGDYFRQKWIGRGTAMGDWDDDGRQDLVVVHHHAPVALLRNRTPVRNHRFVASLVGTTSNRDGIGVRATAVVGAANATPRTLVREASSGDGYLGTNDRRVFFGLGDATAVDSLELRWPSGRVDRFERLAADAEWQCIEGRPPRLIRKFPAAESE